MQCWTADFAIGKSVLDRDDTDNGRRTERERKRKYKRAHTPWIKRIRTYPPVKTTRFKKLIDAEVNPHCLR